MDLRNALSVSRAASLYSPKVVSVACLSTDAVGMPMCVRGDRIGDRWRVTQADPHDGSKMVAVGILLSKSTPTVGLMQLSGTITTLFTGLVPGKPLFVSPGGLSQDAPSIGVGGYSIVQIVGVAVASDVVLLDLGTMTVKRKG